MPAIATSRGPITVSSWGYQLQGTAGAPLSTAGLQGAAHDLVVIDYSADGSGGQKFTPETIAALQTTGQNRVVVSYISIGEASYFRDFWDPAWTDNPGGNGALTDLSPSWLGPTNADWPESRKVRFWDPDWQDLIFNGDGSGEPGWLDQIVTQGFDGAYLDIVDAWYFWSSDLAPAGERLSEQTAAEYMVDFIVAMTAHARQTNPNFFVMPQNPEFLLAALGDGNAARRADFIEAMGGIGVEDTYFRGDRDENNGFNPDHEKIANLKADFRDAGVPVFVVDYVNTQDRIATFIAEAADDGFIPLVATSRELDAVGRPVGGPGEGTTAIDYMIGTTGGDTIRAWAGHDVIAGRNGNDLILGGIGNDWLVGNNGSDRLTGDAGNDTLKGDSGLDVLTGGAGKDTLTGGASRDIFDFNSKSDSLTSARDRITDFQRRVDDIDLSTIDANSRKGGNQAFKFIGETAFTKTAGELHTREVGSKTYVEGDVNGDGRADFAIEVTGTADLVKSDFIL